MALNNSNNPELHRLALFFYFLTSVVLFFLAPYITLQIRASHIGSDYERIAEEDSEILNGLRSFRDIGFEIWSNVHSTMANDPLLYVIFVTAVYTTTFMLIFVWYPRRVFVEKSAVLVTVMVISCLIEIPVNVFSQFPPPPGFIQYEPRWVSYLMGFVPGRGYDLLSGRAVVSIVYAFDLLTHGVVVRAIPRFILVSCYCVVILGFLWSTHQMYTASLFLNIVVAFAVAHVAVYATHKWEHQLQEILNESDPAHRTLVKRGSRNGRGDVFRVDSNPDSDEEHPQSLELAAPHSNGAITVTDLDGSKQETVVHFQSPDSDL